MTGAREGATADEKDGEGAEEEPHTPYISSRQKSCTVYIALRMLHTELPSLLPLPRRRGGWGGWVCHEQHQCVPQSVCVSIRGSVSKFNTAYLKRSHFFVRAHTTSGARAKGR